MANQNWIEVPSQFGKDFILLNQISTIRLVVQPPDFSVYVCWGNQYTHQIYSDHVSAEKAYTALKTQIGG